MDFFQLIRQGDLDGIKAMVEADKDILTRKDSRGFSPLIMASYSSQLEVTEYLLDAGVDVNGLDAAGNTALIGICFKGNLDIVKLLLEKGADVNIKNSQGDTALSYATKFGHPAVAEVLLTAGARE